MVEAALGSEDWEMYNGDASPDPKVVYVCISSQLCLTHCDPMDFSLPDSSVREILQSRILEWVAISYSKGSSPPKDRAQVS